MFLLLLFFRLSVLVDLALEDLKESLVKKQLKIDFDEPSFDEAFGTYGMEHVDWSNRVSMSGIQPGGFHDIIGSEQFFKILNDSSTVTPAQRSKSLKQTRELYSKHKNNKSRIYVKPLDKSKVPEVSYVIPFQGTERRASIRTVINNVKAQRFPRIEIIVVEQCKRCGLIYKVYDNIL